jgi:prepilin-type N-terminal cleavage/methylation domain-containing protein
MFFFLINKSNKWSSTKQSPVTGFTIVEVLVVVVIVAIFAAIAVPSWLGFLNQRRVNVLRGEAYQALQSAQTQAKSKNLSYAVSFRNLDDTPPEVAVYEPSTSDIPWQPLGDGYDIKSDQVTLTASKQTIVFNYQGNVERLVNSSGDAIEDFKLPYSVTLSIPNSEASTKRCVAVETLIGAMTTKQGSDCP